MGLQYLLPQHALSNAMFWLTRRPWPVLIHWAIRLYVRIFRVDLSEAAEPDPRAYPSFNAFFTRRLRADARPLPSQSNAIACPVDGRVSRAGRIHNGALIQAKGRDYSLAALLGGDPSLAALFEDGLFATLYLSPRDYHRIHMPIAGRLRQTILVPGRLFSVNPTTAAAVPDLFARNERAICLFDTRAGPMAVILVGAIFVGSIETVWSERLTPPRAQAIRVDDAGDEGPSLSRGDEFGRFNMGSTVILLFAANSAHWEPQLQPGTAVRCGEQIGQLQRDRLPAGSKP
ncbi:MAG: archaetidylserine decarboxylase [Lamprobacter sp.]|nr:archaetidylserine decarboxylase [Lamprobacter sp.]